MGTPFPSGGLKWVGRAAGLAFAGDGSRCWFMLPNAVDGGHQGRTPLLRPVQQCWPGLHSPAALPLLPAAKVSTPTFQPAAVVAAPNPAAAASPAPAAAVVRTAVKAHPLTPTRSQVVLEEDAGGCCWRVRSWMPGWWVDNTGVECEAGGWGWARTGCNLRVCGCSSWWKDVPLPSCMRL